MEYLKWFCFIILLPCIKSVPIEQKIVEYRLPEGAVEVKCYTITLNLQDKIFQTNAFSGVTIIEFKNLKSTNEIKLHANGISFSNVKLTDGLDSIELQENQFDSDLVTDILTITTKTSLLANAVYFLQLEYNASLRTDEMYGFYKSSYIASDGATQVYLGTTQFQPTSARKAFPCFDEPNYKATFDITIKHPSMYNAVGNTAATSKLDPSDNSYTITTFATTPRMSTYLIAFVVSDFTCDEGVIDENLPHYVCSREEAKSTREIANDAGPKLVKVLEDWTGITYSNSTITKMHQFAIPDFSAGAMENWGLLTYRETGLLWDKDQSSNLYLQRIKNVVAHEVAHMWFGNLVTTHWWSDTFLNEGFARYFQYFGTAEIEPSWELDKQFVVEQVQVVLASDSSPNSAPVSNEVSSQAQISGRFNSISYNKGASILRMILHFMGKEDFQTGIRKYLNDNKFSNTKPEDLWTALQTTVKTLPSGTTLTQVVQNWIVKAGYPVLEVKSNGRNVTISQKRFLSSGEPKPDNSWYVPVSYTVSSDTNKFEDTSVKNWLVPTENLVLENALKEESDWIILNNQQTGYYRVNYDNSLWSRIKSALNSNNFDKIHEVNRAQLIDDYYNFAKIGLYPTSDLLEFLKYLKSDTSYFPWYSALSAFSNMISRTANDTIRKNLSEYILETMSSLYNSVPFNKPKDTDQIYSLKRALAVSWACRLGLEDCVSKAVAAFKAYKDSNTKLDKNLKSVIYCNGLRHSSDIENDWNYVWEDFKKTRLATEQATIISSLGCAKDETVLNKYLGYSIDASSGIRQQDALSVFSSVYTGNPEGVDIAFNFLLENYKKISEYYGSMNSLSSLFSGLANRFTRKDQTDKLQSFLEDTTTELSESVLTLAHAALDNAKINIKWTEKFEDELAIYFNNDTTTSSSTSPTTTSATSSSTISTTPSTTTSISTTPSTTTSLKTSSPSSTTMKDDDNNSGASLTAGVAALIAIVHILLF